MASAGKTDHDPSPPSVFLSYASEDRTAARALRDALAEAGLEVWYDENELGGGDEWDQKIRRQIRECDYFMPVISAQTQARHEGYFRREWRLAVDRTLDIADGHLFLIPVLIDDTDQATARVPDRFTSVQWIRAPEGRATPALRALCARLLSGGATEAPAPRRRESRAAVVDPQAIPPPLPAAAPARPLPEFPVEEPGQRLKFWVHVVGWAFTSVWILFQRLPRWVRALAYIWLIFLLLAKGCSDKHEAKEGAEPEAASKLKVLSDGVPAKDESGVQGAVDIARAIAEAAGKIPKERSPLLAIPFTAGPGDTPQAKLADSAFTLLYGRLAISHQGKLGVSKEPMASLDPQGAAERGRARHSTFVLCGGVEEGGGAPVLTVDIVRVADGSLAWTKSYPAKDADPAAIAADVESHIPALDDD